MIPLNSQEKERVARLIDQTMLDPAAKRFDYEEFIKRNAFAGFHAIFTPPIYVEHTVKTLEHSKTLSGAVVGFPMGWETRKEKLFQMNQALSIGADEIDFVINISKLRSGEYDYISDELNSLREEAWKFKNKFGKKIILKCIIECCLLEEHQKMKAVELLIEEWIPFVKTSTGKNKSGATVGDVRFLKETGRGLIEVKASGGIRTLQELASMVEAGATRIGTSAGLAILDEIK